MGWGVLLLGRPSQDDSELARKVTGRGRLFGICFTAATMLGVFCEC